MAFVALAAIVFCQDANLAELNRPEDQQPEMRQEDGRGTAAGKRDCIVGNSGPACYDSDGHRLTSY